MIVSFGTHPTPPVDEPGFENAFGQVSRLCRLVAGVDTAEYSLWAHSYNVGLVAAELARLLGLGRDAERLAFRAGLLHDCGKAFVPPAILSADRRLTPAELEIMQEHPERGAELITAPGLEETRRVVLEHHERWAGGGYPRGIGGDEIHPIARVVSVADWFVAFCEPRSYKGPKSIEESIEMLAGQSRDGQHEPGLYELLNRLPRWLAARISVSRFLPLDPDSCAAEIKWRLALR